MNFIKKHFLKIKNALVFGLTIVLGIFAFPLSAGATLAGSIGNAFFSVIALFPVLILALLAYLANLGALLSVYLFNWITSPGFINLSYTDPARNEVIKVGLDITKQFVNMGLVVVLIFIALAIALRIKEYGSQKTLIKLIAVALLVNFAPVICGLIVDASNIVMNYFLAGIKEGVSGVLGGLQQSFSVIETLWSYAPIKEKLSSISMVVVYLILNLTIEFTFGILAVIFFVRYIAIWILVILSPLAFVAWILPATKKFWDQWWEQFIQWSIIGIPLSFFVYLAMASFNKLISTFKIKMAMPGIEAGVTGALDFVLPYFVVIIMIWLGIVIGLQTSAMGATGIISFAKSKGKATVRGTVRGVGKGVGWVGKKAAKGVGRYVEEKAGLKEKVGKVVEKWSKYPGARWFLPERVKKYGEFRPAIDEAKGEAKVYKSPVLMDDVMTGAAIGKRAGGFTLETIMRGDSEDIFEAGRRKFGKNLNDEQLLHHEGFKKVMKRTLQVEKEGGYLNDVTRRDPRLAALLVGESWAGDYAKMTTEKQAIQQATSEARGSHITNWEKQVVSKEHLGLPVTEKLMERGREPFENIARNVKQGVETVQDSIDTLFSNYAKRAAKPLGIDLSKPLSEPDHENLWSSYKEFFKKHHKGQEGFFVALEGQRFRDLGYRRGKYIAPPPPPPSQPGGALGLEKPPAPEGMPGWTGPTKQ